MDAIKLEPLDQVSPVVENQPHLAGGHGVTKSLAVDNQLNVVACLVPVFKQRDTGPSEFGTQPAQEGGAIDGWND
jgi:hypothetical protein